MSRGNLCNLITLVGNYDAFWCFLYISNIYTAQLVYSVWLEQTAIVSAMMCHVSLLRHMMVCGCCHWPFFGQPHLSWNQLCGKRLQALINGLELLNQRPDPKQPWPQGFKAWCLDHREKLFHKHHKDLRRRHHRMVAHWDSWESRIYTQSKQHYTGSTVTVQRLQMATVNVVEHRWLNTLRERSTGLWKNCGHLGYVNNWRTQQDKTKE